MAITDASPIQDWIRAFDAWDQGQRRFDAAGRTGSKKLIVHLASDLEIARRYLNAARGTSMPKGPRGGKRPAVAIGQAVLIGKFATVEIEDDRDDIRSAAVKLGRKGGEGAPKR